mmetsp:Transcript_1914/g.4237  ORF Transcript_1914/g.4237 Transcript_1914/m.4237 type:complete len:351 (-) Transcript_1914:43-1095(-)
MDTFKKVDLPTIIVEECNLDGCLCKRCGSVIVMSSLRVSYIRNSHIDYMHLECFRPRNVVPIQENNVMISVSDPVEANKVTEWIAQWNSQFNKSYSQSQSLEVKDCVKNRVLLCVFEFLSVKDLIVAGYVNKKWYKATWESELWRVFILRDFKVDAQEKDRRNEYIKLYQTVCMNCYQKATEVDICPLLRRPLCLACRTVNDPFKEKYGLLSKKQLMQVYGVDANWLRQRNLKWTRSKQNHKLTYQYLFIESLYDLRRWNQARIVEFLINQNFSEPLIDWTRHLDIKELHTLEGDGVGGYISQSTFKPLEAPWSSKAQVIHELLRIPMKLELFQLCNALNLSLPVKRRRS